VGLNIGHESVVTYTAFRNSMELLFEVASMKCVRLLVTAKEGNYVIESRRYGNGSWKHRKTSECRVSFKNIIISLSLVVRFGSKECN